MQTFPVANNKVTITKTYFKEAIKGNYWKRISVEYL